MKHMKLSSVVFSFALLISAALQGSQANVLVNTKNNNNIAQPVNQFKQVVAVKVAEMAMKEKFDIKFAQDLGNNLSNVTEQIFASYKKTMVERSNPVLNLDALKTIKTDAITSNLTGFPVSEVNFVAAHAVEIMDVIIDNAPKAGRIAKTKAAIAQFGTKWIVDPVAKVSTKVNSYIPARMKIFGYKTGLVLTTAVVGLLAYRTGAHKHVKIPNSFKFKFNIW
jgi:hypothetical protein